MTHNRRAVRFQDNRRCCDNNKCLPRKRIVPAKPSRKDVSKTGIERHLVRQPLEVIRMSLMNYWRCSGKLQPLLHSMRNESPLAKTRPRVQRTETTTVTMTAVRAKIKSTNNISHGSGDNGKGENSFAAKGTEISAQPY